jgi:hypothetical protein
MATFVTVYHSGVVTTNEIDSYKFVGMKKETFLLNKFLTLANVVRLVREKLGWMNKCCEVQFQGRIDIGSSNDPRMKTMSLVCDEKEWTTYVGVMMKSEIHGIKLVVRRLPERYRWWKFSVTDFTRSGWWAGRRMWHRAYLTITKTQADTDAEEPPFIASNETVLNVEPVCKSVGVGDVVADTGFISGVDLRSIATGFAHDIKMPFIEPEFMSEYEATFEDEHVKDSANDQLVPNLSNREKAQLYQVLAEHAPGMPDCQNLIKHIRL